MATVVDNGDDGRWVDPKGTLVPEDCAGSMALAWFLARLVARPILISKRTILVSEREAA